MPSPTSWLNPTFGRSPPSRHGLTCFITIMEARLHRVSFETCSPQTLDPIIENNLQGRIYRFCLYNFVEFGTLLHYQERTARMGDANLYTEYSI